MTHLFKIVNFSAMMSSQITCNLFPGKIICLKIITQEVQPSDVFQDQLSTLLDKTCNST